MEKKLKAIILLGAPGAGKGTQANLLAEKLDLYHIDNGKMLRRKFSNFKPGEFIESEGEKYYFEDEKKKYDTGELNNPFFILGLIKETIKQAMESNQGLVLSGSPRTLPETKKLMPFLTTLYGKENIKIFFLDLDVKDSIWRNSRRRICELMEHSILYSKETKNLSLCPFDGSKLIKRKLDTPETIKKRFEVFEQETFPIVKYIEEQGFEVNQINGKQAVANVHYDILENIIPS